jgi:predicted nucleic acid-binding protein
MKGLLDTSVLIAREQGRPLGKLPDELAISVISLAELHLGVLMADDPDVRAVRLATVTSVEREMDALPIDGAVAQAFARIVSEARRAGRRPTALDALIAATAVAHDLTIYTQDADYSTFLSVSVTRV